MIGMNEKKCAECGKIIYPTPAWIYKTHDGTSKKYYCSWSCYKKGKYGVRVR